MNYLGRFLFFCFAVLILCTLRTQRYCIFIVTANLETLHLSCLLSKHNIIYIYKYKYKLLSNLCAVFLKSHFCILVLVFSGVERKLVVEEVLRSLTKM